MTVNPIQVQKFLSGVDYPASKEEIVSTARDQGADDNVLSTLEQLGADNFNSPSAVSEDIGKLNK